LRRRWRLRRSKLPLGEFAFVIRVRIAGEAQGSPIHGFAQHATTIGFEDCRPEVLAAAKIGEIRARAKHQQASIFVSQSNVVTIAALYITIEVGLVGVGDPHGAGVKEIQTLELQASLKLKC
jgi:hypothetical protein